MACLATRLNVFGLTFLVLFAAIPFISARAAVFDEQGNRLRDEQAASPEAAWKLLKISESRRWNGVALKTLPGWCTAWLLETGGPADAPAYFVTNGHCYNGLNRMPLPGEVLVDEPTSTRFYLNFLVDGAGHYRRVQAVRLEYATMTGTDLAVYRTNETLTELKSEGFTAYELAAEPAAVGEQVTMIGVPAAFIPRNVRFLRRGVCRVEGFAPIREAMREFGVSTIHQCSSVGGSSGSPLISLETGKVVAINNTGVNDDSAGSEPCALNRPCEVGPGGELSVHPDHNYAQPVQGLAGCFNLAGRFDLSRPSCGLAPEAAPEENDPWAHLDDLDFTGDPDSEMEGDSFVGGFSR